MQDPISARNSRCRTFYKCRWWRSLPENHMKVKIVIIYFSLRSIRVYGAYSVFDTLFPLLFTFDIIPICTYIYIYIYTCASNTTQYCTTATHKFCLAGLHFEGGCLPLIDSLPTLINYVESNNWPLGKFLWVIFFHVNYMYPSQVPVT